jgi:hypothetical protein
MRVDARDVLDANAKTARHFRGKILGHFRRTGPNAWDDYEYVSDPEGEIDVLPGLKVQLEKRGADFRMRHEGRVIRVSWIPDQQQQIELQGASIKELRQRFVADCVTAFDEQPPLGPAALIVSKLDDD